MVVNTEKRVTNRDLMRKSGMSASELCHWRERGLLPAYCGRYFNGGGGCVYYYPAWAVNRAGDIKRLRDLGYRTPEIREILRAMRAEL